jgi:hypothetical protein
MVKTEQTQNLMDFPDPGSIRVEIILIFFVLPNFVIYIGETLIHGVNTN